VAGSLFEFNCDFSFVHFDDAVGGGKPQSGPFANLLGGKEGLKHLLEMFSGAIPVPLSATAICTTFRSVSSEFDVDGSPVGHRLNGVLVQVGEYLHHLFCINLKRDHV
jgi:hypothetical protein